MLYSVLFYLEGNQNKNRENRRKVKKVTRPHAKQVYKQSYFPTKIGSQVSNYFLCIKWVILHDQQPQYGYSMRLIHRVIAFPPHAILSRMFYQPVLRACWFIPWQAALKSYYSCTSILCQYWPGCHSDSHTIFDKDWSGTSPNRTGSPKLVGSSHRHQPGRASLVLPPRLDRSDYSEPWYQPTPPDIITQEPLLCNQRNREKSKMSQPHINEDTDLSSDPNYFNNTHSFNTANPFNNVWNNCTIADDRSGILAWLSPLERTRHDDIRARRIENVGDWLLQTEEYRNWLGGTSNGGPNFSALFCYGDPGVGKTYIR